MNTYSLLEYLLRATVVWLLLLLAYRYLLRRNANWTLHRRFLLGSFAVGLLIPLMPGPDPAILPVTLQLSGETLSITDELTNVDHVESAWNWKWMLPFLYFTGAIFVGVSHLYPIWRAHRWKRENQGSGDPGLDLSRPGKGREYSIIRHPDVKSPFAALGAVFLPVEMEGYDREALAIYHERQHLLHAHPTERSLLLPGKIFLWFHPVVWWFDALLSNVHEFQVDARVIATYPRKRYALALLRGSMRPSFVGVPHLFSSPLKKRIQMITQPQKTTPLRPVQWALLSLLLGGLLFTCSDLSEGVATPDTEVELPNEANQSVLHPAVTPPRPFGADPEHSDQQAFLEAIYREIRYPASLREQGRTAALTLTFVVDADGQLDEFATSVCHSKNGVSDSENAIVVTGFAPPGREIVPLQLGEEDVTLAFTAELFRTINAVGIFEPPLDKKARTYTLDVIYRLES